MIDSFFMNRKNWVILFVFFLLSFTIRIIYLSYIPNGLQLDEVNAGYQGYKIIKTGSDLFGTYFPVYINRFGDYRPGGIFYLSGISTFLFGLTVFSVRLPVAFISAFTVFPLFFLVRKISQKNIIAFLSVFLLVFSPWDIVAGRATSESLVSLFFVLSGVTVLLYAFDKNKRVFFGLSFICFLASYFFYHIPRLFVPAFLLVITLYAFLFYSKEHSSFNAAKKKLLVFTSIIFVITIAITFTQFGTGRFSQTAIFSSPALKQKIIAYDDSEKGNILSAKIFHNKGIVYTKAFFDQYLSYFSTNFLYVQGGLPQRYVVMDMGLFYYIELLLFPIGGYFFFRNKSKFGYIVIIWFFLAPIAAALTLEDSPNVQRSIFMLVPFFVIESYGLYYGFKILERKQRMLMSGIIFLGFALQCIYFFHMYFVDSPAYMPFYRNDGNQELFAYLKTQENNYSAIYLSSHEDLAIYYSFFNKSTELFSETPIRNKQNFILGKYVFLPADCPQTIVKKEDIKGKKVLFVDQDSCLLDATWENLLKKIYRKDSTVAYKIGNTHSL